MSGCSDSKNCPKCEATNSLEYCCDDGNEGGECYECGYEYHTETVESQMSLEEVNKQRIECEMAPLTELKKQVVKVNVQEDQSSKK